MTTIPQAHDTAPGAAPPPIPISPRMRAHLDRMQGEARTLLADQLAGVRAELARVDAKTGLLLSWAGGAAGLVAALASAEPRVARAGLWVAVTLLVGAVAVLLAATWPRLPRRGATGFLAIARYADTEQVMGYLGARLVDPHTAAAADLHHLARITRAKYRALQAAIVLLLAALVVLAAVLPAGVTW
ncbi:Pycsar system effector family protein [Sphaerisporangium sp. NPDC005288]|uniref:Pycsar system effector family protein n=1 Tax=Sphaerisporangium sp. NPDC005288 TaxID=3155114 RepID=UPI0033B25E61